MWSLESLMKKAAETMVLINGRWVPARPAAGPLAWRIKAAWAVLRGQADAFTWPEGQ